MTDPKFDPLYDMPITKDVSQALAEFYDYRCQLSGRDVSAGGFHVDHIFPRALGGPDNLENYVIAEAAANIGKQARRLEPSREQALLLQAAITAPKLLKQLTDLREGGGSVNPIVVRAFRLLGLTTGTRVASGAYLRAAEELAPGVRWWGYWGPDRKNGLDRDGLQFGLKLLGKGRLSADQLRNAGGLTERGGDTFYVLVPAVLPLDINADALRSARDVFLRALKP